MSNETASNSSVTATAVPLISEVKERQMTTESTESPVFAVKELSVKYGEFRAVRDVTLDIREHEITAFIGPSGCGKTTALRVVAGLEHQDAGTVLVADRNISDVPAHKRNMGMVFQAYSLFPNLTVEENVAFGLQMRNRRLCGIYFYIE